MIKILDFGVYMKALLLVRKYPDQYSKHHLSWSISHQGEFYWYVHEKKARGSGYAEILIEATLVITGTLVIAISGKAYSKALFNLKAVESHERLFFKVFGKEAESHQCMLLQILLWTAG